MSRLARLCAATVAVLALLPVASAPAQISPPSILPSSEPRPGERCANENLVPTAANVAAVRAAVLCLHNDDRSARGLRALRQNAKLRRAARRHSAHMDRANFFAHETPGGARLARRLASVRYFAGIRAYSVGENLGWGIGPFATAKAMQGTWMASPGHRRNVLDREFREIGIGIVIGSPRDGTGAIYTVDFGYRR